MKRSGMSSLSSENRLNSPIVITKRYKPIVPQPTNGAKPQELCALSDSPVGPVSFSSSTRSVPFDVYDCDNDYVLCFNLPGIDQSTLHLYTQSNALHVSCAYLNANEMNGRVLFRQRPVEPIAFTVHVKDSSLQVSKTTVDYRYGLLFLMIGKNPGPTSSGSEMDRVIHSVNNSQCGITLSRIKRVFRVC